MPSPSLTLLRTQTDERLAALARAGHERAFEAIVERYRRPLLRAARRVLPEERAEDALQQALLNAWTALQRGDEVHDLRPWLYRIVHNTSLNALRVSGYDYDELHETLRIADAGDDELERRAVVRQTLASVAALPERQREALLRTAVGGHSQEDVARDLGVTDNALRQLVHRARVSLRAAATALTPLPVVTAAASGSPRGTLVERIAELAAGAAPAGGSVTLAKAGTAVVLAGSVLSGPTLVDKVTDRPTRDVTASASAATSSAPAHPRRSAPPTAAPSATPAAFRRAQPSRTARRRSGAAVLPARHRTVRRHAERERSGRSGGEEESGQPDDRRDSSGPGSGGGDDPRSSNSGPGGGDDGPELEPVAVPSATPSPTTEVETETDSHSGRGSSGSGSGDVRD